MNKEYQRQKQKEVEKIHAKNLIEEASEIVDPCTNCGLCNGVCPTKKILKEEHSSTRSIAYNLKAKKNTSEIFKNTLNHNAQNICPLNLALHEAIIKAKEALIIKGYKSEADEQLIENIKKTGNIFGIEP